MSDVIRSFTDAMLDAGITPPDTLNGDGLLHRCHVEGDRAGTLNLAYVLHLDGKPAGWWMYFKTGVTGTWSSSGKKEPLTPPMLRQIADAKAAREQERQTAHQAAKAKAQWIWEQATPITEQSKHPYLMRKRVNPYGARLHKGSLVIPLMNEANEIVNLQFIHADGTKRFLSGGRKKACYYQLGDPTQKLLIAEGYATACSLHEHTGHCVIVAFDAGNLEPVARAIRSQYPNNIIVICADGDPIGIEKATIAAYACNGMYIAPPMAGQDFNDFINAGGVVYG